MATELSPAEQTAVRLAAPAVLWVVRVYTESGSTEFDRYFLPLIDCVLIGLHWWANQPLRAVDPDEFGRNTSATKVFLFPIVLGAFFLVRDVKQLFW